MPVQLTSGDRKIVLIAAGIFVFMLVVSLALSGGGDSQEDLPTTYSAASAGVRAAYFLLKESGYVVGTWEQPLRDLADGKGKILILAEPMSAPASDDRRCVESFLRSGGRVIAAGTFAAFYLPQSDAIPDPIEGIGWRRISALAPSRLTRAAPEITLAPQAYWRPSTSVIALYGKADKPSVVKFKVGDGEVLWLAAATPFTNAGLKVPGNLEFLLAAVGEPGHGEILWDEFIHGYQRYAGEASPTGRIVDWILLQLAIFGIAVLFAYSRRSGPIWVPLAETRLSPLEFVRTLGSLYQHANAGQVAVDISYQRFRYQLTRRLGLSVSAPVADLERAVHQRWTFDENAFGNTLRECEACRYDPNVPASVALRLVQSLYEYARQLKLAGNLREEKNEWKRS